MDFSDETSCPPRYPDGKYCLDTSFTCNNTYCINPDYICDGGKNKKCCFSCPEPVLCIKYVYSQTTIVVIHLMNCSVCAQATTVRKRMVALDVKTACVFIRIMYAMDSTIVRTDPTKISL